MAKKEQDMSVSPSAEDNGEPRAAGRLPVVIHGQYIKDLSFENPNAPASLRPAKDGKPVMDINFSMDAHKIAMPGLDNAYEVTLGVAATAKKDGNIAFILEVEYALTVSLEGVAEESVHPMLLIEMPRYMFPFVRQIVANVTQQGGFMPLMLAPVDFRNFYMQRYGADPQTAEKVA
jgi:preprotein translocase subunit SecB